jgi:hypothetical protein
VRIYVVKDSRQGKKSAPSARKDSEKLIKTGQRYSGKFKSGMSECVNLLMIE